MSETPRHFSRAALISGIAFGTEGGYSDPIQFGDAVCAAFGLDPEECLDVHDWMEELASIAAAGEAVPNPLNEHSARTYVLARDVAQVLATATSLDPRLMTVDAVVESSQLIEAEAQRIGLDVDFAELRVVDAFPAPYEDAQFAAMTYDRVDESMHGICPGVALKSSGLRPLYSVALMAHEFVHVAIGRVDTPILARGLEEGVADLVGGIMLARCVLGQRLAEIVLFNSRQRYGRNQLGRLYRDGLLAASAVVLTAGSDFLISRVREANHSGRQVIQDLEAQGLKGAPSSVVPHTFEDELRSFAMRYVTTSPDTVVSPLALTIGEALSRGDALSRRFEELGVNDSEGMEAVGELQDRVFLLVPHEGEVASTEVDFYRSAGVLRYEP